MNLQRKIKNQFQKAVDMKSQKAVMNNQYQGVPNTSHAKKVLRVNAIQYKRASNIQVKNIDLYQLSI